MMQTRPKDTWLFVLLCILIFWAPIPLGSNRVWAVGFLQAGHAALAATLCLFLAQGKISPSPTLLKSLPSLLLFFAIPCWIALQLLPLPPDGSPLTLDVSASLKSLQTGLWLALLFGVCLQILNTPERLRTLALVIIGSGVFEACYAVITILGGADFDILAIRSPHWQSGSATGTYMNRNHLAGYLEMCLSVGTGLMIANIGNSLPSTNWRERARSLLHTLLGPKTRQRLLLVSMVIALVMTHSRMGNTAFFAAMGISAGIGFIFFKRRSRSMVLLFGSMILIDLFIISAWFGLDKLAQRIEQTPGSREGRLTVNPEAWIWTKEHWLTGSGAGSFTSVFPSYRNQDVIGFYDYAHNDYLQLLGEYGVLGAALFAAIALYALWTSLQAQRERHNSLMQGMAFGSMMGIICLIIHSSTDFNLHIPANAALLTVLCAIAFISRHMQTQTDSKPRRRSTPESAPHDATAIQQ
ncbi:MAG: O-antigen ligase family protein [Moraxellaceae bacterium]